MTEERMQSLLGTKPWHRIRFVLYRAGVGIFASLAVGRLPHPWDYVGLLAGVVLVGYLLMGLRPRPCEECGRKDSFPIMKDPTKPRRPVAWWDLRFPLKRDVRWLCLGHAMAFRFESQTVVIADD